MNHPDDHLRKVLEQIPTSVVLTDLNGGIEYVNPTFTAVTGYTFDEVRGKNPRILQSGNTPVEVYKKLWQTIRAGGEWHGELQNKKKNGELFWESVSISALTDDNGKMTHFLAAKEDITSRKLLERQLLQSQKLEGVGTLAGGIAHDFNNLLAVVLGSAERLHALLADHPEMRKHVERIIQASERGSSISRQLLIFSRPDMVKLQPISLSETIREIQDLLKHFLPKSIAIHTSIEVDDGIIMGESGQIHQALLNLALNAGDAMAHKGTLTIREFSVDPVYIRERFAHDNTAAFVGISVSDTGVGMDADLITKIFDPFFTTKPQGKGTGLGLAMVHGIVKSHNGFIDVMSVPGEGTTVALYFPMVNSAGETGEGESTRKSQLITETILLVDDEVHLREMLAEFLTECGYNLHLASNGVDAIEIFQKHYRTIDLVITDLGMPLMGGAELFRRLVKIDADVKAVATSGYLDGVTKEHLMELGFKDVLTKPSRLEFLHSVIRRVLLAD